MREGEYWVREFRHGRCGPTRPCWMPRFYPYNRCLRPPLIGPRTKLNQSHVAERRPGAILYRMGFICSDPRLPLAADFHRPHWLSHWRCNCKRRPQSLSSITFEAFAFLLPANFQYFGPWAVLSIALQFYFGVRLLRIFFGRRLWPSLCGGLLLTISPPLAYRLGGHFALANHWLILAAFCLYFSWQRGAIKSGRKLAIAWCSLTVIAVATTGYLALCVVGVLGAACVRSLLVRPPQWRSMSLVAGIAGCFFLLSGYAIGVIRGGGGLAAAGYRMLSMNLLAPVDSRSFGALLIKDQARFPGQYEGYNYLGLGTLVLILILAGGIAATPRSPRWPFSEWAPLVLLGFVFTALALSTKVTAGSHVVFDLDPHERLSPYLGVFRGSGRLFWVPYYLITAGAVIAHFVLVFGCSPPAPRRAERIAQFKSSMDVL